MGGKFTVPARPGLGMTRSKVAGDRMIRPGISLAWLTGLSAPGQGR
ncbi:MAG: hypothetical protein KGQ40_12695 [Rhodospirillales bacterium]|nr:hypothetical protein [Rhodospirillales bacterium]